MPWSAIQSDRYVNSQLNAVHLPTADADKRAVQLDPFPAALIDSIQVSKTFTPDQYRQEPALSLSNGRVFLRSPISAFCPLSSVL